MRDIHATNNENKNIERSHCFTIPSYERYKAAFLATKCDQLELSF